MWLSEFTDQVICQTATNRTYTPTHHQAQSQLQAIPVIARTSPQPTKYRPQRKSGSAPEQSPIACRDSFPSTCRRDRATGPWQICPVARNECVSRLRTISQPKCRPEKIDNRRMRIWLLIGMHMMQAMDDHPADWRIFETANAKNGQSNTRPIWDSESCDESTSDGSQS